MSCSGIVVDELRMIWLSMSVAGPAGRSVVFGGWMAPWHVQRWPNKSGSVLMAWRSSMRKVPDPVPFCPCAYFMAVNRSRVVWR